MGVIPLALHISNLSEQIIFINFNNIMQKLSTVFASITAHKLKFQYIKQLRPQELRINKIPDEQLNNSKLLKKLFKIPIDGRCRRSQLGLWHGIRPQSGNQTCFSEKKLHRLRNHLGLVVHGCPTLNEASSTLMTTTMKALRCIRKVNGLDNYILMTKPKQLDSVYGEYLRRIMLKKLNDPGFQIHNLFRGRITKTGAAKLKTKFDKIPAIWYPPEMRHKDLYKLTLSLPNEASPQELRQIAEIRELRKQFKDIPEDHPVLKEIATLAENDPLIQTGLQLEDDFKKKLNIKQIQAYYGLDGQVQKSKGNKVISNSFKTKKILRTRKR